MLVLLLLIVFSQPKCFYQHLHANAELLTQTHGYTFLWSSVFRLHQWFNGRMCKRYQMYMISMHKEFLYIWQECFRTQRIRPFGNPHAVAKIVDRNWISTVLFKGVQTTIPAKKQSNEASSHSEWIYVW